MSIYIDKLIINIGKELPTSSVKVVGNKVERPIGAYLEAKEPSKREFTISHNYRQGNEKSDCIYFSVYDMKDSICTGLTVEEAKKLVCEMDKFIRWYEENPVQ